MKNVFYWQGLLDPNDINAKHKEIIDKLLAGHYQSLDLEKLAGHHVYSVRVNHSDRLFIF